MAKVLLTRGKDRWFHWCPGCEIMHPLPDRWAFNGRLEMPTFRPFFKHRRQSDDKLCHYAIEAGSLRFMWDTTAHALAGQLIPMPEIPEDQRE